MAIHTEVKKQKQAALEALKIIRGERTMDNASTMALQLINQYNEAFIRTIATGEFKELVTLKPLPAPQKPVKVDNIPIVEEILEPPKAPEPEKKVVKGSVKKKSPKKKTTKKKVEDKDA